MITCPDVKRLRFFLSVLFLFIAGTSYGEDVAPICKISATPLKGRFVVIGDVHGAFNEMNKVLIGAKITAGSLCEWLEQDIDTTVIQMGDIVDRGDGATEAWECLEKLQLTAPANARIIRLVGNHELWWLEGHFHMRNKVTDTREKVFSIVEKLKAGIHDGSILAAHVERLNSVPVLFVHAGFRRHMMEHLVSAYNLPSTTADGITNTLNALLVNATRECRDNSLTCQLADMVFQAGPDRGGSGIGGPFWTDFKVFVEEAQSAEGGFHQYVTDDPDIMQIVGHTAKPNNIRYTKQMRSICIDSGMVYGTVSYLEIESSGRFQVHMVNEASGSWEVRDMTAIFCGSSSDEMDTSAPLL